MDRGFADGDGCGLERFVRQPAGITARSLSLPPVLMAAANSAGGVMGKMIAAQSLVVAAAAVGQPGTEGDLFRKVFPHSIILASLVGLIVLFFATAGRAFVP